MRDKFLVIIVSIMVLVFGAFSFSLYRFEKTQLIENSTIEGEVLIRTLSNTVERTYKKDAPGESLRDVLSTLRYNQNIRKLIITDAGGVVMYDLILDQKWDTDLLPEDQESVILEYPILTKEGFQGLLQIVYSLRTLKRRLSYFKYFLIIAGFTVTVTATLLAFILAKMVTRQVDLIHDVVKNLNEGSFSHKVPVITNDELGELAETFNRLFVNLKESYIESYHKTKSLLHERNKLNTILSSLQEGVVVTDRNDKVIEMNKAAEGILSIPLSSIGENVYSSVPNQDYCKALKQFNDSDNTAGTIDISLGPEEDQTVYKVSLIKAMDDTDENIGTITVFIDTTREHHLNKMKTRILRTISHELKTPIISIIGFLNLLKVESVDILDEEQYEYVLLSYNSAKRLKLLINNLLDLTRLETGNIVVDPTDFNLNKLIDNTLDIFQIHMKEKKLSLSLEYCEKDHMIYNDMGKISQIITNIIDNAVKFTEDGTLSIKTNKKKELTIVTITDTGVGIPKNKLSEIFESFKQADESLSRQHDGIGLGLSIVRELVKLLNGTVSVDSTRGKGTTFTVTLPDQKDKSGGAKA